MLDHIVVLFLDIRRTSVLFSIFTFPPTVYKDSFSSTSFLTLISCLFDNHSKRFEVLSHYPNNKLRWTSFHMSVSYLYVFLKNALTLFLVVELYELYILDFSPFLEISITDIFSKLLGCLCCCFLFLCRNFCLVNFCFVLFYLP